MKKTIKAIVKTVNKVPLAKKGTNYLKREIVGYIDYQRSQQEIYNLQDFYPTIPEYYAQIQDAPKPTDPLISILLPTYNTPETYLRECIDSIIIQSYPKWELCIADDHSSDENVLKIIREYQQHEKRIKVIERKSNGHISEATNSALEIATGDYVGLMDHDDVLWPNALYEFVSVIRNNPKVDFIYSDEDKIDGTGVIHSYPFLKPDFSPEFLESCNYITHFSCMRSSVIRNVGGFRKGYEGAQDWDLFIRISEVTNNIFHIPKLLYSWRVHAASTASDTDAKPYVYEAQLKLLKDHLTRSGESGTVETGLIKQHRTIKYDIEPNATLAVFIQISTIEAAKSCIDSIANHSAGCHITIHYVANNTVDTNEVLSYHEQQLPSIEASIVKDGISITQQHEYFAVIHDTSRQLTENWAKLLLSEVSRKGVGFVGPAIMKIETDNLLSAGVGLGYGDSGVLDMLQNMPLEDPHYTRGLYARSRRNVTAVNESFFATSREVYEKFISKQPKANITEAMYNATLGGYRNIYTPYVRVAQDEHSLSSHSIELPANFEDPMLNPNFKKTNPLMEVRRLT